MPLQCPQRLHVRRLPPRCALRVLIYLLLHHSSHQLLLQVHPFFKRSGDLKCKHEMQESCD